MLQFAAAHLGYLRLCLEMTYHPVLTASGADKTLTCVSSQTIMRQAQSQVKECPSFKDTTNKCKKKKDNKLLQLKVKTGGLFLFLFFISLKVITC